jgi:hypothetical protein
MPVFAAKNVAHSIRRIQQETSLPAVLLTAP